MLNDTGIPNRWYYLFPPFILILSVGAFAYWIWHGISSLNQELTTVVVPGETTLRFHRVGTYTVFYERNGTADGKKYSSGPDFDRMHCMLTENRTGKEITLKSPSASTNYSLGDVSGRAISQFEVTSPGDFSLNCWYLSEKSQEKVVFAIGEGAAEKIWVVVLPALGFIAIGFALSLGSFVLILMKRSKVKTKVANYLPLQDYTGR